VSPTVDVAVLVQAKRPAFVLFGPVSPPFLILTLRLVGVQRSERSHSQNDGNHVLACFGIPSNLFHRSGQGKYSP